MQTPTLAVDNLTVALPPGGDREEAVSGVSLTLSGGETHCLVGESGSGKSVIGQAILGMLPSALPMLSGQVSLFGEILPAQRDRHYDTLRSVKLATIFQDATASLNPVRKVGSQLGEILSTHGAKKADIHARVLNMLEAVGLEDPAGKMNAYPHQLSGGQAQRVVIAGALLLKPSVLVADEPTTALDVTTQAAVLELLDDLKRTFDLSVLFITHDFGVVAQIADSVTVLKDGRIVESGRAIDVLSHPQHEYTKRLLAAAEPSQSEEKPSSQSDLLEVTDLNLVYRSGGLLARKTKQAVKDVSLSIAKGRTLGIVGESGSGKSSLARAILRLEPIESGAIVFKGQDISEASGSGLRQLRKSIQVVLQDPFSALNPRQTIGSAIAEGLIIHGSGRREARKRTAELLELTGLTQQAADRYPHEFSGGQRQRICIARALALEPELLIADEAVSALDVSIQAQILELFADLQRRLDFAMIFITHDLRVARAICDDVIVMKAGEIVEQGTAMRVLEHPVHDYTKALVEAAPHLSPVAEGAPA